MGEDQQPPGQREEASCGRYIFYVQEDGMLEDGWARINSLLGRGKEPLVDSTFFMFRRTECWRLDGRGSTASWAEARSLL
jgi:hypothetical protein